MIDPEFYRPNEVEYLRGSCHKATHRLGWYPKTPFETMVERMVDSDYEKALQNRASETVEVGAY